MTFIADTDDNAGKCGVSVVRLRFNAADWLVGAWPRICCWLGLCFMSGFGGGISTCPSPSSSIELPYSTSSNIPLESFRICEFLERSSTLKHNQLKHLNSLVMCRVTKSIHTECTCRITKVEPCESPQPGDPRKCDGEGHDRFVGSLGQGGTNSSLTCNPGLEVFRRESAVSELPQKPATSALAECFLELLVLRWPYCDFGRIETHC